MLSAWRHLSLTCLRIVLFAVAYAGVGLPALLLATPPGYAAPIFPSAGIALAAGVIYGYRVLPAVFFGSLLMRLIVGGELFNGQFTVRWLAVTIAAAATLQAAVGTRLVKDLCGPKPGLDTPSTIIRFVLMCPLAALVSASISTPALVYQNIIARGNELFTWWNWWIGDTLGMLVGAPIVFALLAKPRENWSARKWTVALPLLVMIGVAAIMTGMIARWENQRIEGRFGFDAQKLVNVFRNELRLDVLAVQAAAHGGARLNDGSHSPAWMSEVPSIRSIGRLSIPDATGPSGSPVLLDVSSRRDEDERILAMPTARSALERALSTQQIAASEPWTLESAAEKQTEFLVWIPDLDRAPGARAVGPGPVYAVINVNRLDPRLLANEGSGLAICWVDRTGTRAAHRIAGPVDCERAVERRPLVYESAIPLWGRDWLIRVVATPQYAGALRSWGAWSFSAMTVLAIGAMGMFLLLLTGRAQTIGRVVQERTTELEREKSALRSSESLLRKILDHASVGITFHDLGGRFIRVNPRYCEITGYSADELSRMRSVDLIHPEDRSSSPWPSGAVADAAPDPGREVRYIRKDGSIVHVLVRWAIWRDEGEPDYAVAVTEDITERRRLRDAERARLVAEEATRAKDDFLSRMSHELRTPLNAIIGFAQVLLGTPLEPLSDQQRKRVEHVETAGWHLLAMINDVLDLSRIEGGTLRLSVEPTVLDLVLRETVAMLSGAAAKQEVAVRIDVEPDSNRVLADATRLKQVLANLLSNAIKYTPRGGTVTVTARRRGQDSVLVTVSDTGHGMSPLQLANLFQPFNRLGREAGSVPGTGIGLVVTKRLVELMNGRIDVSSVEQQGSTFAVTLGIAGADPASWQGAGKSRPDAGHYGKKRVAYFEDNPLNAEVMRAVLSIRPQIRLDVYVRASDGIAAIEKDPVDLLLLDMGLPDARGIDILRRLKGNPATARVPVIIVSADAVTDHIGEALRAGALAYIAKPIERALAIEWIDRALGGIDTVIEDSLGAGSTVTGR
jgi:PAS domain S-box-containing protein